MRRVAFRVSYPPEMAHPLHRRLARTDGVSRMELLQWGPTAAVTTLSWYDASPETVRTVLDAVETVTSTELVEGDDGTYAFVRQSAYELDAEVLELVERSHVVFLPPVTFFADGDAVFEAVGETPAVSALYARLRELLDARIERVDDFRRGPSSAALTDRQRSALEAAAALGYYEVPRTASVEDVATELGCASSTAGELLRRAESALVAEYASGRTPLDAPP
jgi:predicted DNA binding protein